MAIPLRNVFFDYNKYSLKPESYPELNRLANFISKNKDLKFEISGHTDNKGSNDYNKQLSQKRADAVKAYLVNKGCNSVKLKAVVTAKANRLPIILPMKIAPKTAGWNLKY